MNVFKDQPCSMLASCTPPGKLLHESRLAKYLEYQDVMRFGQAFDLALGAMSQDANDLIEGQQNPFEQAVHFQH